MSEPTVPIVDVDAGSDYEALCTEMLIDPVQLAAEIKAEIEAPLPVPTVIAVGTVTPQILDAVLVVDGVTTAQSEATS